MSKPRTETGRRILRQDYRGNESYTVTREDILAIEGDVLAELRVELGGLHADAACSHSCGKSCLRELLGRPDR